MADDLKIEKRVGEVSVVAPEGMIDASTAGEFGKALEEVLAVSDKLVCDFQKVSFISSAGLGKLVAANSRLKKKKGRLMIAGLQPKVRNVFDGFELPDFFQIRPDAAAAIQELGG